ncbi:hypothetical protein T484DRAFT_1904312, partial [Baffinella frigidus]
MTGGSEWAPGTTFRLTLSTVRTRPFAGTSGNFTITFQSSSGQFSARGVGGSLTLLPGLLSAASLSPLLARADIVREFYVNFTTANIVPPDADFVLVLPAGFILQAGMSVRGDAIGGVLSVQATYTGGAATGGELRVLRRSGQMLPRGSALNLTLLGIPTRRTSGVTGTLSISVRTLAGAVMDSTVGVPGPYLRYDSPVVAAISPDGRARETKGGGTLTVSGGNFGPEEVNSALLSPFKHRSVAVGGSVCAVTTWVSDSSVACKLVAGVGASHRVVVTIENQRSSNNALFSFDAPLLAAPSKSNIPSSPPSSITITGGAFGSSLYSQKARLGGTAGERSSWVADSTLLCRTGAGSGGSLPIQVTVAKRVGSALLAASYDTPSLRGASTDISSARNLTVSGGGFLRWDASPGGRVGVSACERAVWLSDSSLLCRASFGVGRSLRVAVTTSLLSSTITEAVSYEMVGFAPGLKGNVRVDGGGSVVLTGRDGAVAYSARARVGHTACETSAWVSSTAMLCGTPSGVGRALTVALTAAVTTTTAAETLSFDTPAPLLLRLANLPVAGGGASGPSLLLPSNTRGLSSYSATARLGFSACQASSWATGTALLCKAAAGVGGGLRAVLTVGGVGGTLDGAASYDAPSPTSPATPMLRPAQRSIDVLLAGAHLPPWASARARVGGSACEASVWVSSTALACHSARGAGASLSLVVTVGGAAGGVSEAVSYEAPGAVVLRGGNVPTAGVRGVDVG